MKKSASVFVLFLLIVITVPFALTACNSDDSVPEQFRIVETYDGDKFIAFYYPEELFGVSPRFTYAQGDTSYVSSYYAQRLSIDWSEQTSAYIIPNTYIYVIFPISGVASWPYTFTTGEVTLHVTIGNTEYATFTFYAEF